MADERLIHFKNLEVGKTRTDLVIADGNEEYPLYFEFNREIQPTNTEIAHALSTLCGEKYAQIEFAFEIPANVANDIQKLTGAEVIAPISAAEKVSTYLNGNVLSFSGGFDSMAAKALMPDDTHLVSIDYGGWFTREADFFQKFEPIVISTNARRIPDQQTAFTRNHPSYMAIGALLTRSYLGARYHTFGNILGSEFQTSGPSQFRLSPLESVGLVDAPYTSGITELGTAKIMTLAFPHLLGESIESLAGKRDRKRLLKIALIHASTSNQDLLQSVPPAEAEWSAPVEFNDSYTTALGALALYSRGQGELIRPLFRSMPASSISFAESHDFSFMEKVNWDKYQHLEPTLHSDFWTKLSQFGFTPYTEDDWENVHAVRKHLNFLFMKEGS